METGDIYVFAHHTGAITIARRSDKTSLLVDGPGAADGPCDNASRTEGVGRQPRRSLAVDTLNALDGPLIALTLHQPLRSLTGARMRSNPCAGRPFRDGMR